MSFRSPDLPIPGSPDGGYPRVHPGNKRLIARHPGVIKAARRRIGALQLVILKKRPLLPRLKDLNRAKRISFPVPSSQFAATFSARSVFLCVHLRQILSSFSPCLRASVVSRAFWSV